MSISTVQVLLTEESQWAVETDDPRITRLTYQSRREAIAAGVHMAMEQDAVLMIHGAADDPCGLDFRGCNAPLAN
ncbi:DUF2188 domain-containing protein [Cupriavidus lacunae]|uniref:DUF2188 domain-containing protein n=1 Tax=Cupriavidus lacunae TaxID=2666307 RepID=A0A370P0V6_9BURK|nr:DUF2188 domain-containing protein [Cupriavidus lacunae]RDK11415.1 DUF2188 domain-containing protein [Cupriavidus lacunae]